MWDRGQWQGTHKIFWWQNFPEDRQLKDQEWDKREKLRQIACEVDWRTATCQNRVQYCGWIHRSEFSDVTRTGEVLSLLHNYIVVSYPKKIEAQLSFTLVGSESDLFYSVFWLLSPIHVYFNAQTLSILGWISGRMLSDAWFVMVHSGSTFGKNWLIFVAKRLTLSFVKSVALIIKWESFEYLETRWTGIFFSP